MSDCFEIVDEGADFAQVDDAALMLGLPMAPFELLSLVGPAVGFLSEKPCTGPGRIVSLSTNISGN